ncbi:MAG: Crp/Fnr family transcriptional regulator, partial [Omnitrophica WOR_2 bacterium]
MNKTEATHCLHCRNRSDIFTQLNDSELSRVNDCRVSMHYSIGEIIFKQGSPCHDFVCVTSGLVKCFIEGEDDKKIIIGFVRPVEYIFAPGAYVDRRHHFTAIACEETSVCLVSSEVFQDLIKTNSSFANEIISKISFQAIELCNQLTNVTHKQIPGRMADTLLRLSQVVYKRNPFTSCLTRQDMADMCGMTKESVVRAL